MEMLNFTLANICTLYDTCTKWNVYIIKYEHLIDSTNILY